MYMRFQDLSPILNCHVFLILANVKIPRVRCQNGAMLPEHPNGQVKILFTVPILYIYDPLSQSHSIA